MPGWFAEVEFTADITLEQLREGLELNAIAEGAPMAHYNLHGKRLRLGTPLDADDYESAMAEVAAWARRLKASDLAASGRLQGPTRMLVETAAAHIEGWDLLGAKEAAIRLEVSTGRLRQLEQHDRRFPKPVMELAGGRIWRADEIDTYAALRVRGEPGRPRKATAAE